MPVSIPVPFEVELVAWLGGRLSAEGVKAYTNPATADAAQILYPFRCPEGDKPAIAVTVTQSLESSERFSGVHVLSVSLLAQGDPEIWEKLWLCVAELQERITEPSTPYTSRGITLPSWGVTIERWVTDYPRMAGVTPGGLPVFESAFQARIVRRGT